MSIGKEQVKGIAWIASAAMVLLGVAFLTDTFIKPAKTNNAIGIPLVIIGALVFIGFCFYGASGSKK